MRTTEERVLAEHMTAGLTRERFLGRLGSVVGVAAGSEADDGTRTHDLLQSKQKAKLVYKQKFG